MVRASSKSDRRNPLRGPSVIGPASPAPKPRNGAFSIAKEKPSNSKGFFGGGIGTVGVLVLLAIRVTPVERNQARQARANNQPVVAAPFGPTLSGLVKFAA